MQSSDVKHLVIMQHAVVGPFGTHEVIELFKRDPSLQRSILWISPERQTPLLLFEWFAEFAEGLHHDEPLGDSDGDELSRSKIEPHPEMERKAELPPDPGGSTPAEFLLKRRSAFRDWLGLICLTLLGVSLLWFGVRALRPARPSHRLDKPLSAKMLGATPEALKNYQNLLSGKINGNALSYARSLLAMQKDRGMYPEGVLPSDELTTVIALVNLSHEELDRRDEWKQLLNRLPTVLRQRGLAVVAYELSRVFALRRELLTLQGSKQKKAQREKIVERNLDEVGIILERMIRVVPQSEPQEKILHGLLLSRVLSLSLISVIENANFAQERTQIRELVQQIPQLHSFLSSADRALISELVDAANAKFNQPKNRIVWTIKLERMIALNQNNPFLCQLNETGSGPDTLLFFLTQALHEKQQIPKVAQVFDRCFVGLRLYPRVFTESADSDATRAIDFVTLGPRDDGLLRNYRDKIPTFQAALARLSGKENTLGDWQLLFYQNRVLSGRLMGLKKKSSSELCGKNLAKSQLCLQVLWTEASDRWRDLVPLVLELRDQIRPDELRLLGQNFIFHAAREATSSRRRGKVKDFLEALKAVNDFVDSEDPQIQFLLDYAHSLGVDA